MSAPIKEEFTSILPRLRASPVTSPTSWSRLQRRRLPLPALVGSVSARPSWRLRRRTLPKSTPAAAFSCLPCVSGASSLRNGEVGGASTCPDKVWARSAARCPQERPQHPAHLLLGLTATRSPDIDLTPFLSGEYHPKVFPQVHGRTSARTMPSPRWDYRGAAGRQDLFATSHGVGQSGVNDAYASTGSGRRPHLGHQEYDGQHLGGVMVIPLAICLSFRLVQYLPTRRTEVSLRPIFDLHYHSSKAVQIKLDISP